MWADLGHGEYQLKISEGKLCVYLCPDGNDWIYLKTGGVFQGCVRYDSEINMVVCTKPIKQLTLRYKSSILNCLSVKLVEEEQKRLKNIFSLLDLIT